MGVGDVVWLQSRLRSSCTHNTSPQKRIESLQLPKSAFTPVLDGTVVTPAGTVVLSYHYCGGGDGHVGWWSNSPCRSSRSLQAIPGQDARAIQLHVQKKAQHPTPSRHTSACHQRMCAMHPLAIHSCVLTPAVHCRGRTSISQFAAAEGCLWPWHPHKGGWHVVR